ncbi:hypothetical protein DLM75_22355 [Leptospira stimsonii]|uniref:Uncharacterized protein n=1 Tax=Leptospira stimsonii TaxID=2202203 RepID=A0A396YTU1_9LEPT|nr:hypothetical protein DLM75_22355 [Leptospira stimsonii]
MALSEKEFKFAKSNIEKLQEIITEIKNLREELPPPVSKKLNEGLGSLESGLFILLDSTYKG